LTPDQILARLRVLFGIPVGDTAHDNELKALFETALAAARAYTGRWLYPLARFSESFQPLGNCCGGCGCSPVVVSEVPVKSVESAVRNGTPLDAASVFINSAGVVYERPGLLVFPLQPFARLELVYLAGFEVLPAEVAEALCQVAASAGGATVVAAGGTAPAAPVKKFTVFDVGAVEYATAAGSFYSAELAAPGSANAILGPWTTMLDPYRDVSKSLGMSVDDCVHLVANLGAYTPAAASAAPATVPA
jgi:hypothetical protein